MTYTRYIVKDGQAVPENPFERPTANTWNIQTGSPTKNINQFEKFEQWKQSHTYATDAPDGIYPVERFEIVWQVRTHSGANSEYVTVSKYTADRCAGFMPRQFAQFIKEVEKVDEREYILCAAIIYDDGKKHEHMPKNIEQGIVICGRRHHNCYSILAGLIGDLNGKLKVVGRESQGFITNLDRYVDRKEGYLIAKQSGQLIHNLHDKSNPILISEDLY